MTSSNQGCPRSIISTKASLFLPLLTCNVPDAHVFNTADRLSPYSPSWRQVSEVLWLVSFQVSNTYGTNYLKKFNKMQVWYCTKLSKVLRRTLSATLAPAPTEVVWVKLREFKTATSNSDKKDGWHKANMAHWQSLWIFEATGRDERSRDTQINYLHTG